MHDARAHARRRFSAARQALPDYPGEGGSGGEEASGSTTAPPSALLDALPDYPAESDEDDADAEDDAPAKDKPDAEDADDAGAKKADADKADADKADADAKKADGDQADADAKMADGDQAREPLEIIDLEDSDDDVGVAPKSLKNTMQFAAQVPPVNSKGHRDAIRAMKKPAAADGQKKQDCRSKTKMV